MSDFFVLLCGEGRENRYIYGENCKTMSENNTSKLSKWLESLQQESWQLELIISGFAIFLVGSLGEPLDNLGNRVSVMVVGFNSNFYIMIPLIVPHS